MEPAYPEVVTAASAAAREIMTAYPDEAAISAAMNRVTGDYGGGGLAMLAVGLVILATPAGVLLHSELCGPPVVMPVILAPDDHPDRGVVEAVGQFIAAVTAQDKEMGVAIFEVHVTGDDEHSSKFLSYLIATTCRGARDRGLFIA